MSARILVADDERGFRDLFAYAFEPMGYRVVTVSDGAQALAQAATRPFDLVVLDHHMPHVNGLEALRQIRALLPKLPAMMVSGSSQDPVALQALAVAAGAACLLFKPIDLEQLILAVQSQLPRKV